MGGARPCSAGDQAHFRAEHAEHGPPSGAGVPCSAGDRRIFRAEHANHAEHGRHSGGSRARRPLPPAPTAQSRIVARPPRSGHTAAHAEQKPQGHFSCVHELHELHAEHGGSPGRAQARGGPGNRGDESAGTGTDVTPDVVAAAPATEHPGQRDRSDRRGRDGRINGNVSPRRMTLRIGPGPLGGGAVVAASRAWPAANRGCYIRGKEALRCV